MFCPNWCTHKTLLEKSGGSVTLLCHSMNDSIKLSVTKTAKQYHHSDSAALVPCSLRLEPNEMNHYASTAKQHHRSDFAAVALCSTRFEFNVMKRLLWSVVARKYPIHCAQFGHTHLPSETLKTQSKQLFQKQCETKLWRVWASDTTINCPDNKLTLELVSNYPLPATHCRMEGLRRETAGCVWIAMI